jgi:hypothetical protein
MAQDLPDVLRLREIKYGAKTTAEERSAVARQFLEAGSLAEALDLFLIVGDEKGIRQIRLKAIEQGRPALLLMLVRAEREVTPEEWRNAGEAARRADRPREAFRCFAMANDEAALEDLRSELPDYEIYIPQGK